MVVKLPFNRIPIWLWPNVLSLDAPLIASLWQNLFATAANVSISWASRLALPLAVWMVYLLDRLLDTADPALPCPTARHRFSHVHRKLCLALAVSAASALCVVACYLPVNVIWSGLTVSSSVALYLLAIHVRPWPRLPKEALVSVIFAAGTALAPFVRSGDNWRLLFPALLFSLLCWLNCSAIEAWEGGSSNWAARHMKAIAALAALCCIPLGLWLPARGHCALALFFAATGLWRVAGVHLRVGREALRVWTDVPLLAPLLLMSFR